MKRATAFIFTILIAASLSFASEKGDWWSNLKSKVRQIAPTKTTTTTTAVGGMRGTKEETETVYWKGKDLSSSVTTEELESFNSALDYAMKGDNTEAKIRFENFLRAYPSSALAGDARQSLKVLSK